MAQVASQTTLPCEHVLTLAHNLAQFPPGQFRPNLSSSALACEAKKIEAKKIETKKIHAVAAPQTSADCNLFSI